MHMLNKSSCDLVECNGNAMIIHNIKFDDFLWDRVIHTDRVYDAIMTVPRALGPPLRVPL